MSDESLQKVKNIAKNNFTIKFNEITGRTELRTFVMYENLRYIKEDTPLDVIESFKCDGVSIMLENLKHEVLTDKEEAILRGEYLL